ncbi:hypothetical protein V6N12_058436 [Hibiscus sabdariffa]|uniref:Uncharacterized protein n=1 Tax=Hibiscus sabdariffa TaxID=183260 RepID=A0ABR2EW81_9ROSI
MKSERLRLAPRLQGPFTPRSASRLLKPILALNIEEATNKEKEETHKEAERKIETFPPKIVAMHRLNNMICRGLLSSLVSSSPWINSWL